MPGMLSMRKFPREWARQKSGNDKVQIRWATECCGSTHRLSDVRSARREIHSTRWHIEEMLLAEHSIKLTGRSYRSIKTRVFWNPPQKVLLVCIEPCESAKARRSESLKYWVYTYYKRQIALLSRNPLSKFQSALKICDRIRYCLAYAHVLSMSQPHREKYSSPRKTAQKFATNQFKNDVAEKCGVSANSDGIWLTAIIEGDVDGQFRKKNMLGLHNRRQNSRLVFHFQIFVTLW